MTHYYFDNAATTPMSPTVVTAMSQALADDFGNASSTHYFGRQSHHLLDQSRQVIANSIHAKTDEIIFTSGGTEGDNTAISGTAVSYREHGKHIITTQIEHPAVLKTMSFLEKLGYDITYLPVDEHGLVTAGQVKAALRPDTILVSIMTGNNEIGAIEPIAEIGAVLKNHQAIFHTDAVQAYGILDIDVQQMGVDLLSISGHKLHGPKGIGFLYMNEKVNLEPFMHGGEQEHLRRAGTENIPSIIGLAQAVKDLTPANKKAKREKLQSLKAILIADLKTNKVDFAINGPQPDQALPHVLNIWIKGLPSTLALMNLDLKGFAVSAGSACTAGSLEPSHVLTAITGDQDAPQISESLRVSFGDQNTEESVHLLAQAITEVTQDYLN
ncbi:cysteine desulfurase [Lapidilactobacillus dextrinicus DSM 20335]|uniref:cysteine desulfurase n=1 Tax=Lapidilactobacillus dextrinicus DSM 20335 TaxID=1423738 RepID=A0A0R2BH42_9LACO|nr:cysteine desulfurase family protein [Lapidilactobacillus dextrinicus]KRM78304.1 cysteine desulfurase [Lapidilactobacillus dextrinicus DSM 20335]QFG47298.1 cysteine desulfurase [Lapidilactobacillus dextrinicus]